MPQTAAYLVPISWAQVAVVVTRKHLQGNEDTVLAEGNLPAVHD